MTKKKFYSLIQVLLPLTLLVLFVLCIAFPSKVPFLQIRVRSSAGIGTESFVVTGGTDKDTKIKFNLKRVPAGTAPGGCTDIPDGTRVASPFLLAETEVTRELWQAVFDSAEKNGFIFSARGRSPSNGQYPAEGISWRDAVVWCNALSSEMNFVPAYYADASYKVPVRSVLSLAKTNDTVFVRENVSGFRLPSSDEWELAARYIDGIQWTPGGNPSGSPHSYYYGSYADGYAVFMDDAPLPVKSRASNKLGIYDMSGNVWEWCFDRFGSKDVSNVEQKRVVRGGSWMGTAYRLQIGGKFGTMPDAIEPGQGFRIARSGW